MPKVHDRGGWPETRPIDRSEHAYTIWEKRTDALVGLLGQRGLLRSDELRRAIESLEPERYETLSYYERWLAAVELLLGEKGVLTREEVDHKVAQRDGHPVA